MANPVPERPRLFNFDAQGIRVIGTAASPWFIARDVCAALEIANSRDALASLEDDEKGVGITDTLGGPQELAIVNESGLYALIFRSRKPSARLFRRWVTNEVLPQIRRTGGFTRLRLPPVGLDHPGFLPEPARGDRPAMLLTRSGRMVPDLLSDHMQKLIVALLAEGDRWSGTIGDVIDVCLRERLFFWIVQPGYDSIVQRGYLGRQLARRAGIRYSRSGQSVQLTAVGAGRGRRYVAVCLDVEYMLTHQHGEAAS